MIINRLLELICDEFGIERSDIDKNSLLETLVSDDYEMQQLMESIEEEFEVEADFEPAEDWSIEDLADHIASL